MTAISEHALAPQPRAFRPAVGVDSHLAPALLIAAVVCYSTNILEMATFFLVGSRVAAAERLLNMAVYGLLLALAIRRAPTMLRALTAAPVLALTLLIPLASIIWSVDRPETAQRLFAFLSSSLVGLYAASTLSMRRMLIVFALGFAAAAALNLGAVLAFADARGTPVWPNQWRGFNFQKNALGRNSVIGALLCAFVATQTRGRLRLALLAAVVVQIALLMKTGSRTSQVVLAVAFLLGGLGMVMRRAAALWLGAAALGVAAGGAAIYTLFTTGAAGRFLESIGRDATLTGRVPSWEILARFIDQRPALGWGYAAFYDPTSARIAVFEREIYQTPVYGHNGYIDVLISVGWAGLGAVLVAVALYVRDSASVLARWPKERSVIAAMVFLIIMLIVNVTESKLMERNEIVWILFLGFALSLAQMRRLVRAAPGRRADAPSPTPAALDRD